LEGDASPQKGHTPGVFARTHLGDPVSGDHPPHCPQQPLEPFVIRLLICLGLALIAAISFSQAQAPDPQNTLVIETSKGNILIRLRPDLAPKHVAQVKRLAKEGFYNGIVFHRVIAGFMAQTGDPSGTGTGGSKLPNLPAEFTQEEYKRGSVGAARTNDPNSANSQFFICLGASCRQLTGQYTLWGEVIEGMENVDKIARGEPPPQPDKMLRVYVLADKK
jgi:peptidylprolyl isomerase